MRSLLFWLSPLLALAADNKRKYTVDDLEWGKIVYGAPLTEVALKDKGLVLFLFVFNEEVHPETMLNKFQADLHATKGNISAIAVESVMGAPGKEAMTSKKMMELTKFLKKFDYEFSACVGLKKRPPGFESTLPYCYVMNYKKVIIYSGPPRGDEYKSALDKAATPPNKSVEK
jgi:hypothetical protein